VARGTWRSNDTYLSLAIEILKEKKKPMDLEDISKKILQRRKGRVGSTPKKSIYSALWVSNEIKITKDCKFALKDWE
jgi:hypothetical protein